jgi:pimeloyl-ACP methyl ester carboxylesterase
MEGETQQTALECCGIQVLVVSKSHIEAGRRRPRRGGRTGEYDGQRMGVDAIGTERADEANGTLIAWSEMGAGPPLVLLHGFQQSRRTWRRVAPLLADGFRLLLPDLPGHGLSGRPDAPYTLTWYAETMAAWMDAIGVPRAHLCGHSFGGGIAQWMLLEHRARIDRLALVAPGGLGREVGMGLRHAALPVLGRAFTPLVIRYGLPLAMRLAPAAFGGIEAAEVAHAAAANRIPGTDRAFRRSVAGVIRPSGQYVRTMDRIHEVASLPPMALFWGEKDPVIPHRHGRAVFDRITGITLKTYPRSGHFPHLDAPDAFARDLRAFLRDPDRPDARIRASRFDHSGSGPAAPPPPASA